MSSNCKAFASLVKLNTMSKQPYVYSRSIYILYKEYIISNAKSTVIKVNKLKQIYISCLYYKLTHRFETRFRIPPAISYEISFVLIDMNVKYF